METLNPVIKKLTFRNKADFYQHIIKDPSFLSSIVDIHKSAESSYFLNRNQLYEFLISSLKDSITIFFLYHNKEPIGVMFGYHNTKSKGEFTLSSVAIKKEYQRKGFGKVFLKKAYLELEKLGYTQISLVETTQAIKKTNENIVSKNSKRFTKEKRNGTLIKFKSKIK